MLANVEERVLAVSREHPDYGARRIVPLLKQEEIFVSASTIYNILKRNGLETRTKRLLKLGKEHSKNRGFAARKTPTQITPELEEQIVAASLEQPDFSARRLVPFLKAKEISISESTVYKILKRHGIQTRALRLLKLKGQETAQIPFPTVAPEGVPSDAFEIKVPPPKPPLAKALAAPPKRGYWPFHLLNLLLFVLVGYLGYHLVQNFPKAGRQPEPVSFMSPAPVDETPISENTIRPVQDYRIIWERNLFNINKENVPAPEEKIALDNLAVAEKGLGLKLVGTIVADDTALSRAVINNQKTREQKAYLEGDQAGKVRIKKILRNKVIITSEHGDELLAIDPEEFRAARNVSIPERDAPINQSSADQALEDRPIVARRGERRLSREDVKSSLGDFDGLMQNVELTPYIEDNQSKGLRITGIPSKSILRKMGLRNRDVITEVNNEAITDPDHIAKFFAELMEGGDFTIQVKRRRRTRTLRLNIE